MTLLDDMAERNIQAALERGDFDNLPGAGRPLQLTDDSLVPEELRTAYRIMKNAGYLPPELELHGQLQSAEALLRAADSDDERGRARRRLQVLRMRLERTRPGRALLRLDDYEAQVERRLAVAVP